MWMSISDKPVEITTPVLQDQQRTVTAFKISPDGARMALVRSTGTGSELGLARIIRSKDKIAVDSWRALNTTQEGTMPPIGTIRDVAWLDATELLVLGAVPGESAFAPYRVVEDASRITAEGESPNSDAVEVAVLPQTQTAIIVGRNGNTWRDNGSQWLPFLDDKDQKVSTIAYAS